MHGCSDEARTRIMKDYLSDPNYNYETVNRASKACGPLVKWAIAQVRWNGCVCHTVYAELIMLGLALSLFSSLSLSLSLFLSPPPTLIYMHTLFSPLPQ